MWETNSKNEKNNQKTTHLGQCRGESGLKSQDFKKVHSGPLLKIHSKFQLPISLWRGNGGDITFSMSKSGEIPISPLPIDLKGWLFDMLYNFWFSIDWHEEGQILRFWPLSAPSSELGHNWILTRIHLFSLISDPPLNWVDWPNWRNFDLTWLKIS